MPKNRTLFFLVGFNFHFEPLVCFDYFDTVPFLKLRLGSKRFSTKRNISGMTHSTKTTQYTNFDKSKVKIRKRSGHTHTHTWTHWSTRKHTFLHNTHTHQWTANECKTPNGSRAKTAIHGLWEGFFVRGRFSILF